MDVFLVLLSTLVISSVQTQPTSIDLDYCQNNAVLREISRKLDLLTQQYKVFSISLDKFEEYGEKNAKVFQDRLTELESRIDTAIDHFPKAVHQLTEILTDNEEKKVSAIDSFITSKVSQLQSSLADMVSNTSSTFRDDLESVIAGQDRRTSEIEASVSTTLVDTLNSSFARWTTDSLDKRLTTVTQLLEASERMEVKYDTNLKLISTALTNLTHRTDEELLRHLSSEIRYILSGKERNFQSDGDYTLAGEMIELVTLFQKQQNLDLLALLQNNSLRDTEAAVSDVKNNIDIINLKMDEANQQMFDLHNVTSTGQFCQRDFIVDMIKHTTCLQSGSLRLVNGTDITNGRVEVYYDGKWGTICDDSWEDDDAQVVCRQMGFCGGARKIKAAYGKPASDVPILLDEVECGGGEASLMLCNKSSFEDHDCSHDEDAGVSCMLC